MKTSALLLLVGLLAACGSDDSTGPTTPVTGTVHAGPTCPVVREPPDPACDDRPVAGAVLLVLDASGEEIDRVVTDDQGRFSLDLPAGLYTLQPRPVEGLLGTAEPQEFVVDDQPVELDVAYDTGIR